MGESGSMNAILLANIGNSDLGKNDKSIFELRRNEIYEESKKLFQSGEYLNLDAILLEPAIKKIMSNYNLTKIHLFATEQHPPHSQDTIYMAYIVKDILKEKFSFEHEDIEIAKITKNPANFDIMIDFYEHEIEKITNDTDLVYISISGGTPAQNMALLLDSLLKFGSKVQVIYKPMGSKEARELEIGRKINQILLSRELRALESKHLYGAAADLAEKYDLLKPSEVKYLRAKNMRTLFDFNGTINILRDIKDSFSGERRNEIITLLKNLESLENATEKIKAAKMDDEYFNVHKLLIRELYYNIRIKWEQGDYADFLGRLYRFEEAVLRLVFEKIFNVSAEKQDDTYPDFIKFIEKNEEIRKLLDSKGIRYEPTTRCLLKIIGYVVGKTKDRRLKKIHEILSEIDSKVVQKLRHKTIIAHGFEGVSKEKIESCYEGNILVDLGEITKIIQEI